MLRWNKNLAVLLAILSLGTSRVDAGSMTPYQAVLLDFGEFGGGTKPWSSSTWQPAATRTWRCRWTPRST